VALVAWLFLLTLLALLTVVGTVVAVFGWRAMTSDRVPFDFSRPSTKRSGEVSEPREPD
jgi:hypothetical protein